MLKTIKSVLNLHRNLRIFLILLIYLPFTWSHQLFLPFWQANDTSAMMFLVRSTNVNLSSVFFSGEDLYDNTMESLQWLVPTDIRRFNVFSPQSSFQINMRYRNDPSVKRYFGYQLWKIHETDVTDDHLNEFWKLFG